MNLMPLSYVKEEQHRKWLRRIYIMSLFLGGIGSSISILLPFKIQTLQDEVTKLKENEIIIYKDTRDQILESIYKKEELLKMIEEERQKLTLEKQVYFSELEHIWGSTQSLMNMGQISYKGPNVGWEVIGKSEEIEPIKWYKESLLDIFEEEKLNCQIEKETNGWNFSVRLGGTEEAWHEIVE